MKRLFTIISLLGLSYMSFAQDLNLGLVAYYKLDGDALDAGPNSLNGTITNVTSTANSLGQTNKAMSFTNTVGPGNPAPSSWITLPANPLLQLTGNKSFSFWMKPYTDVPSDGYYESVYSYGFCGDNFTYTVYYNGLITSGNGCNGNSYAQASGYYPGLWQHVVITETSGNQMNIYKNGILIGNGPNQGTIGYGNIPYLGRYQSSGLGSLSFRGDLDQFRIYNRVLTQAEITLLSSENSGALPVTITSFTATSQNDKVALQWATATEINSKEFSIQRSLDGISFKTIGSVPAAGNSNTQRSYRYDDLKSISFAGKMIFFRIMETDIDGKLSYTNVKNVKIPGGNNKLTLVYNPVGDEALLKYECVAKEKVQIRLIDHLGRVISVTEQAVQQGINEIKLKTGNLVNGIYGVELRSNREQYHVRMMKE